MPGMASERTLISDLRSHLGNGVTLHGWVHNRRDLGGIQFLLLRDRSGLVQCVFENTALPLQESAVRVVGRAVEAAKAPGGIEIQASRLELISEASEPPPVEIPKEAWHTNPDTLLEYRHVSVRGLKAQATLKAQAELLKAFRSFLDDDGFTEISTPKLVAAGAEGGANLFEVDYYGKRAYLAQSPQLYKQIMVGVFERVFEVAPVFRAEHHHTSRHLAEYLSLDVELGFIEDDGEVMDLEEALLKSMLEQVRARCQPQLELLEASVPDTDVPFPRIPLLEARELVRERYGHHTGGKDLDPEAERLVGRWGPGGARQRLRVRHPLSAGGATLLHLPHRRRPDPRPRPDLSRYRDHLGRAACPPPRGARRRARKRDMDPERFRGYLEVFKYGMPPHGGFAIGAERLTALLLGIPNVRFARAFPRDGSRIQP